MSNAMFDEAKLERMKECTSAQEVLSLLSEEGFELTDEQLEAIAGGAAGEWSLEKLLASFGDTLAGLFPEGFDPKVIWSNIPTLGVH